MSALLTILLVALAALAPWARSAEYVVAPNGDDAHAGTKGQPFRTLQHAAEVMQPGDTCLIRGGAYRETVRPKLSGEPPRGGHKYTRPFSASRNHSPGLSSPARLPSRR